VLKTIFILFMSNIDEINIFELETDEEEYDEEYDEDEEYEE
jgi:hypothetical protein